LGIAFRAGLVSTRARRPKWLCEYAAEYVSMVAEHLVDVDEAALSAAGAEAGTASMKDTVTKSCAGPPPRRAPSPIN
jgi:hypothetical protein